MTVLNFLLSQQIRQDQLERLYADDGRHDRDHPQHGLYTGLEQSYRLARWRRGCLATPLDIGYGWRPCMMRRAAAHISAGNPEAALRELDAVEVFLRGKDE